MAEFAEFLRKQHGHDWAGFPAPMPGLRMELHPSYPFADKYAEVFPSETGEIKTDAGHLWGKLMDQIVVCPAWSQRAEIRALRKLRKHVNALQFHSYFLTGAFIELSDRSGLGYIFRRLRPTIAFKPDEHGSRFLAALCSHPIGYYVGTHAGAMVPTDDVLAQYLLMKADEPYLWRISNQHPFKDQALWM